MTKIENASQIRWMLIGAAVGAGASAVALSIFKKSPTSFGWLTIGAIVGGSIGWISTNSATRQPDGAISSASGASKAVESAPESRLYCLSLYPDTLNCGLKVWLGLAPVGKGQWRAVILEKDGDGEFCLSSKTFDDLKHLFVDEETIRTWGRATMASMGHFGYLVSEEGRVDISKVMECPSALPLKTIYDLFEDEARFGIDQIERILAHLIGGGDLNRDTIAELANYDFDLRVAILEHAARHIDIAKYNVDSDWVGDMLRLCTVQGSLARRWLQLLEEAGAQLSAKEELVARVMKGEEVSEQEARGVGLTSDDLLNIQQWWRYEE